MSGERAPALVARGVTRRFGSFTAVDDVSFRVEPGEVLGLLGANGAGKTTIIRMLLGLLQCSGGRVELLGGAPDRERRGHLGYVPQGLGLYRDLTVGENLEFSCALYKVAVPTLSAEIVGFVDTLVAELPLGVARQVAFTVALAHQPQVLVLDEPTSGVDALARSRLWDTIRGQADAGTAVLVTTHYMEEAQQCDRLLLMSDGHLVAQGSERDLVGDTTATVVRVDDWARGFEVLNAAGLPVILAGRDVRVVDTGAERIDAVLAAAGLSAQCEEVPATIEERMLTLARTGGK